MRALAATLADTGLRLRSVCVPTVFSLAQPAEWVEELERAGAALELAAALGAEAAIPNTGPAAALEFAAAMRRAGAWLSTALARLGA